MKDANGLEISTSSEAAIAAFNHLADGFLRYRADLPDRLRALLQAAPDVALAHCIQGYMMMLGYKAALVPVARAAEARARKREKRLLLNTGV